MSKALIVIDVQQEYIEKYSITLMDAINQYIKKSSQEHNNIIYIKNKTKLRSRCFEYEFASNLDIVSSFVFSKEKASAFSNREFIDFLKNASINLIEIIGIDGNSCVASTARDGKKLGFDVHIIHHATGVLNVDRFEKTKSDLLAKGILFS